LQRRKKFAGVKVKGIARASHALPLYTLLAPTPEMALVPFHEWPPARQVALAVLLSAWIPHAIRASIEERMAPNYGDGAFQNQVDDMKKKTLQIVTY
jgi:hypothetical protein